MNEDKLFFIIETFRNKISHELRENGSRLLYI